MPAEPESVYINHESGGGMGIFSRAIQGFKELPGWGKLTIVGLFVAAGVIGYVVYKKNSSTTAASSGTTSGTTSGSGGLWQPGMSSGSSSGSQGSQGVSGSSGTTSGTTSGTGSSPTPAATSPTQAPQLAPAVPASVSPALAPIAQIASAPVASAPAPPVVQPKAPVVTAPARNVLGLAENTGTVGITIKPATPATKTAPAKPAVKVPANVTSSIPRSIESGGQTVGSTHVIPAGVRANVGGAEDKYGTAPGVAHPLQSAIMAYKRPYKIGA